MDAMETLPLEKAVYNLDFGKGLESCPALDPRRIEERHFMRYISPPSQSETSLKDGSVSDWLEAASYITDDLEWLIGLPFDLFWCQVIFDTSLHKFIDSFLLNCPRLYDIDPIQKECHERQQFIKQLMFLVVMRLTKHQSKQGYISQDVFGDILYENYIFDIPKLMDFISIYSGINEAVMQLCVKAISSIFNYQPKYFNDLKAAISTMYKVLTGFQVQLGIDYDDDEDEDDDGPVRLTSRTDQKKATGKELKDILLYLLDFAGSLLCFLHVFPQAAGILLQENLIQRLGKIVDIFLVSLKEELLHDTEHRKRINGVESCCIQISHFLLADLVRQNSLQESGSEFYMDVITNMLSYSRLTNLYHHKYNLHNELIQAQATVHLDDAQFGYLQSQLSMIVGDSNIQFKPVVNNVNSGASASEIETAPSDDQSTITGITSAVRDLFPEKSQVFVENCIDYFGTDHEAIISAIVEDRIPDWIKNESQHIEDKPESKTLPKDMIGFDPTEGYLIRKNKDPKHEEWQALFNERSRIDIEKTLALCDMYEDEYDDTYDSQNIGALDADSADELRDITKRRQFVIPQILRNPNDRILQSSSDEESAGSDQEQNTESIDKAEERRSKHHRRPMPNPPKEHHKDSTTNKTKPKINKAEKVRGLQRNELWKEKQKASKLHQENLKEPIKNKTTDEGLDQDQQTETEPQVEAQHPPKQQQKAPEDVAREKKQEQRREERQTRETPRPAKGSDIKYKKHNRRALADKKKSKGMGPLG